MVDAKGSGVRSIVSGVSPVEEAMAALHREHVGMSQRCPRTQCNGDLRACQGSTSPKARYNSVCPHSKLSYWLNFRYVHVCAIMRCAYCSMKTKVPCERMNTGMRTPLHNEYMRTFA